MDIQIAVGIAGFAGGMVNGLIGWASSEDQFSFRKYLPTFLRSAFAGITIGIAFPYMGLGFWAAVLGAFFTSAGFDDVWHRLAATIKKG